MLTKIQLQNLDQTSANIVILLIWSKRNKRITSRVLWNVRARACYTCEHVLPTRASTCFLHVRARYLFVRARLLFKNVPPGPLILKGLLVLSALWLILLSQLTSPQRPLLCSLLNWLLLLSVSLFAEVLQSLLLDFLFSFPCLSK